MRAASRRRSRSSILGNGGRIIGRDSERCLVAWKSGVVSTTRSNGKQQSVPVTVTPFTSQCLVWLSSAEPTGPASTIARVKRSPALYVPPVRVKLGVGATSATRILSLASQTCGSVCSTLTGVVGESLAGLDIARSLEGEGKDSGGCEGAEQGRDDARVVEVSFNGLDLERSVVLTKNEGREGGGKNEGQDKHDWRALLRCENEGEERERCKDGRTTAASRFLWRHWRWPRRSLAALLPAWLLHAAGMRMKYYVTLVMEKYSSVHVRRGKRKVLITNKVRAMRLNK